MKDEPLVLRPATEDDVPFLMALRRRTMSEHLAAAGVACSDEEHLQRVRFAFEGASIVLRGGERVGLLKVVRAGAQWELVQVQLLPSLQGQGLGEQLLQSLIAQARAANASLRLSVLKPNPARRLYERLGFAVVAEKDHSYDMALAG